MKQPKCCKVKGRSKGCEIDNPANPHPIPNLLLVQCSGFCLNRGLEHVVLAVQNTSIPRSNRIVLWQTDWGIGARVASHTGQCALVNFWKEQNDRIASVNTRASEVCDLPRPVTIIAR